MPYFLCPNGTIIVDGRDLIDIRFNPDEPCSTYLKTCCAIPKILKKGPPPGTDQVTLPPPVGCGYRNVNGVKLRITGDENHESQFGEFPWMVAILKRQEGSTNKLYACGGSLIHGYVVLTGEYF